MRLAEAQRMQRHANDTRASQVRADQELKQFYSDVLPGSHAEARNLRNRSQGLSLRYRKAASKVAPPQVSKDQ